MLHRGSKFLRHENLNFFFWLCTRGPHKHRTSTTGFGLHSPYFKRNEYDVIRECFVTVYSCSGLKSNSYHEGTNFGFFKGIRGGKLKKCCFMTCFTQNCLTKRSYSQWSACNQGHVPTSNSSMNDNLVLVQRIGETIAPLMIKARDCAH